MIIELLLNGTTRRTESFLPKPTKAQLREEALARDTVQEKPKPKFRLPNATTPWR